MPRQPIRRAPLAFALFLCGSVTTSGALAQEPAVPVATPASQVGSQVGSLTERFPESTLLVGRSRNVSRDVEWVSQGPFGRMIDDPEIKPLWDNLMKYVDEFSAMAKGQTGVDFLEMLKRIKGEAAFGITRFSVTMSGPRVGVMLLLDCGDQRAGMEQDLQTLLKLVPEDRIRKAERELSGVKVVSYQPLKAKPKKDPNAEEGEETERPRRRRGGPNWVDLVGTIHTAWIGSTIVISNDRSGFEKFLKATKDAKVKALGDTANWIQTMEKLGGAGDSVFYVNVTGVTAILEAAAGIMPDEVGPVITALGLDEFPSIAFRSTYKPNGIQTKALISYTGEAKTGLGSLLQFNRHKLNVPAWIPDDVMDFWMVDYDFDKAFGSLLSLVESAGEEPFEEFEEGLEGFEDEFGIRFRDDLIGSLVGPVIMMRYGATSALSDGISEGSIMFPAGGAGSTLIGVRIRNREPWERLLEYAEGMGADVANYGGAKIVSPPMGGDMGMSIDLAITNEFMMASFGTTSIVRPVLSGMGRSSGGLGDASSVRAALEGLPREGVGLGVVNYGKSLANTANILKMFVGLRAQFGEETDVVDLAKWKIPSSEVFEKYFGYAGTVVDFKPGVGIIMESRILMK